MSIPVCRKITCPRCGAENKFTMWQSINTEFPNARADIISGKLFEVTCKNCGHRTHVFYPILFNDMEHRVMIYFVPPDQVEDAMCAAKRIARLGFRARVVTTIDELREKAMIFESELDDRVVEILKLVMIRHGRNKLRGTHIEAMISNSENCPRFEIVVDGKQGYVYLDMDAYAELAEVVKSTSGSVEGECCINGEWAEMYLSMLEEGT